MSARHIDSEQAWARAGEGYGRRAFKSERHAALEREFPREPQPRRYVQAYRPAPARRVNALRRLARAIVRALT